MFGNLGDPKHLGQQLASALINGKPIGQLPGDTCGQIQSAILRIIRGSGNENMDDTLKQEFITQVMSAAFECFTTRSGSSGFSPPVRRPCFSRASHRRALADSASRLTTSYPIPLKEVLARETVVPLGQSGEPVLAGGMYAVAGVNLSIATRQEEKPVRHLYIGEKFPMYGGWEVCWQFMSAITRT